jgi:TolB-like protein/DNA-binding winged helix-turn-helix (wHTH) protein/Flp pilus assembly protein TadD
MFPDNVLCRMALYRGDPAPLMHLALMLCSPALGSRRIRRPLLLVGQRGGCRATVRFGGFELNPSSGELRKHGYRIRLQNQPFRILCLLVQRPMEVITREEIREKLWGKDTFVDFDRSLNKAMVKLRQALNDDAETPQFIETLPRRGYRFLVTVETGDVAASSISTAASFETSPDTRLGRIALILQRLLQHRTLGGVAVATVLMLALALVPSASRDHLLRLGSVAPAIRSLAVLPLENLSGDSRQDYFADGMTEELTTDLARIHSLRVISRTTVTRYRSTHKSISEIARELNVDAVIEGSVVRSSDKVRITTQLIDARTDAHLWAQSYERGVDDVITIEDSIALDIASHVRANIRPAEREYFAGRVPIHPNAYDDYLRGISELSKQNVDSIRKGVEYFQRAIDDDPEYARAYAGLADAYSLLANYQNMLPAEAFPRAKAAAMKALELDPDSAEPHASLALVKHHFEWDWRGAETEYKRAIELQPNFATAHHRYAWFLSDVGRHDEALQEIRRAEELDPTSIVVHTNLGRVLYRARRFDESIVELREALVLDPSRMYTHIFLGMAYDAKRSCTEALNEFRIVQSVTQGRDGTGASHAYATCGKPADARRALKILAGPSADPIKDWFYVAGAFAGLGEKDRAFEWLDEAIRNHDFFLTEVKGHPFMDPLRSDPRFVQIIKQVGFPN